MGKQKDKKEQLTTLDELNAGMQEDAARERYATYMKHKHSGIVRHATEAVVRAIGFRDRKHADKVILDVQETANLDVCFDDVRQRWQATVKYAEDALPID